MDIQYCLPDVHNRIDLRCNPTNLRLRLFKLTLRDIVGTIKYRQDLLRPPLSLLHLHCIFGTFRDLDVSC
jgi:hypothetical protein